MQAKCYFIETVINKHKMWLVIYGKTIRIQNPYLFFFMLIYFDMHLWIFFTKNVTYQNIFIYF